MFSRRFATNRGGGGAEYGEWEGGKSSSRATGRGEVAVHGEVLMPLLSPALIRAGGTGPAGPAKTGPLFPHILSGNGR